MREFGRIAESDLCDVARDANSRDKTRLQIDQSDDVAYFRPNSPRVRQSKNTSQGTAKCEGIQQNETSPRKAISK